MKQALTFSLKVWLTTVLVTPFVIALTEALHGKDYTVSGFFLFVVLGIIFGALLSLISFGCFYCVTIFIKGTSLKIKIQKVILSLLAIAFIIVPFMFLQLFGIDHLFISCLHYCIVVLLCIWLYKLDLADTN